MSTATLAKPRRAYAWPLACAVLLGLTAVLMRNWLLGGGLPTTARREGMAELTIVWLCRQELAQGRLLSEWNPYWFSGFPWLRFLSYPFYYLAAAISLWGGVRLETVMVLGYFLVMAGSGLAMFGYLQRLLGDWRPALVGAVIYEAFPYHNHVGVETWIHAAFWVLLPLALWLVELSRAGRLRRTPYLLLLGLALGAFPVLSSEYALLAGPFVALYLALRELAAVRRGQRRLGRALGDYLLVGLVALGSAAFFVLPALFEIRYVGIHAKHGAAATLTHQLLRDYSVTPKLVWYALVRRLRLPFSVQGLPGLASSFWSVAWYSGLVAPPLVLLGLSGVRRHLAARAALAGLVLSLLLISGPTCPLNFFSKLPVLGHFSPFRGMLLVVAFGAILAAYGVAWLLQRWEGAYPRLRWASWLWVGGLVALVLADFWPSAGAYQTTEAYFTPEERQVYAWLAARKDQGRLWEVSYLPRDQYLRTYSLTEAPLLRYVGYYDNGAPLHTWEQTAWTDLGTTLRLHQVRFVLLREDEPDAPELAAKLSALGYRLAFQAGAAQVWENPQVRAYAQFYRRVALDMTEDFHHPFQALPELVAREIALVTPASFYLDDYPLAQLRRYTYILVDEPATRDPQALPRLLASLEGKVITAEEARALAPQPPAPCAAWSRRASYEEIELQVNVAEAGVLTIAESWYPHWRVWVDGRPQPVWRTNWALLGVWLEPGEHHLVFRYVRPWYVYLGYGITLVTLLALAAWGSWYAGLVLRQPPPSLYQGTTEGPRSR